MELANQTKSILRLWNALYLWWCMGLKCQLRIAIETKAHCTSSGPTSWVLHSRYSTVASVITGGGPCQMGLMSERSWQLSTMWVTDVQITGCGLLCEFIGPVSWSCHKIIPTEARPPVLFSSYWCNFGCTIFCTHVCNRNLLCGGNLAPTSTKLCKLSLSLHNFTIEHSLSTKFGGFL